MQETASRRRAVLHCPCFRHHYHYHPPCPAARYREDFDCPHRLKVEEASVVAQAALAAAGVTKKVVEATAVGEMEIRVED